MNIIIDKTDEQLFILNKILGDDNYIVSILNEKAIITEWIQRTLEPHLILRGMRLRE